MENVQLNIEIKGTDSVGKAAEKTQSLRGELFKLKEALGSQQLTTQEFVNITDKAAELQNKIKDVNKYVKNLSSDSRGLEALTNITQGVVGGFTAVQGAMALWGSENENIQKTLIKVQGAVALLNGVQALNNALQRESAAMTFLQNARLKLLTFAQVRYAAAVGSTTGVLKVLRIVGMSLGIGLIVVAIGLLIANFDKVKKVVEKFMPVLAALGKFFSKIANTVTDFIGITSEAGRQLEKLEKQTAVLNRQRERDIKLLEAQGGKENEVYAIKRKVLESDKEILKQKIKNKDATEEEIIAYNDLLNNLKILDVTESNRIKKKQEDETKAANERAKKRKEEADKRKKEEEEAEKKTFETLKNNADKLLQNFKEEEEKKRLAKKEIDDRRIAYEEELETRELERAKAMAQAKIDLQESVASTTIHVAQSTSDILGAVAGKNKAMLYAQLIIEKGIAAANIVLNTQKEIAGYWSNPTWSLAPDGGIAIKTSMSTMAKVRAAASLGAIAATGINQARQINSGGTSGGTSAPQINSRINSNISQPQSQNHDIKVIVTETDIRRTTRKIDDIYTQATIK